MPDLNNLPPELVDNIAEQSLTPSKLLKTLSRVSHELNEKAGGELQRRQRVYELVTKELQSKNLKGFAKLTFFISEMKQKWKGQSIANLFDQLDDQKNTGKVRKIRRLSQAINREYKLEYKRLK